MTTTPAVSQERLPSYSIKTIFQLRDKLAGVIVPKYGQITIGDGDDLELLVEDLRGALPAGVATQTIRDTARQLMGQCLDADGWRAFCWRMAGNLTTLKQGTPCYPWRAPGQKEWVPLQVLRVDPAPARNHDFQYELTLRVLAGAPAAMIFKKSFSGKWLGQLSRFVGFTDRRGHRPFLSPYQFASLRIYGLLDPDLVRGDTPNFFEVRCTGLCEEHNRKILDLRYRQGGQVCPQNFLHDCHQCAVGYLQCPAATHRDPYFQALCRTCHQQAWFDPGASKELCLNCWRKQITS